MSWRVLLNSVDITAHVAAVTVSHAAENICGECTVELADRTPLTGIVVPRVPRALAIQVDELVDAAWVSRGAYYLEQIDYPQAMDALTATVWGRSASARLTTPWAQKVSKQWAATTSVAEIIAELAALCGVSVSVANDFPICQYCYVASDQYPSEIIRDLAEMSGQILWPKVAGSPSTSTRRGSSTFHPACARKSGTCCRNAWRRSRLRRSFGYYIDRGREK